MARQLVWQYAFMAQERGMRRKRFGAVKNFSTAQTKLWQELHNHDKDPMTAPTPEGLGQRGTDD
jgi:hypothetical protein